jgi:colanic acid biosynthesis glycosyl transferase WcaI
MKILLVADNYLPEITATSFRIQDHAKHWLAQGHEVTVVTCVPNWPHGKPFPGYRNRLYQEEWMDGVRVIRLGTYMTANKGFLKRTLDYVSFMIAATLWSWRYPASDVIVATSPQFFAAMAGWLISLARRRPWIFEVRDLWPESIKAVGASRGRLIDWLERLELFLYRRADRIVVVTHAFRRNLVSRGIDTKKIDVVTNGVDWEQFQEVHDAAAARRRLGVPEEAFLAGYIGTTGLAHGLETIVEAANLCRAHEKVHFLIMGEGARRAELEALAREKELTNLHFADRVPHRDVSAYLAAMDLPIVHLRPDPTFESVIPSKLFEFMAIGRAVLLGVAGESAQIVADAGCGVCVPPGDARAMADAVLACAERPEELRAMGERGREAASRYDRRVKAAEALQSFELALRPRLAA